MTSKSKRGRQPATENTEDDLVSSFSAVSLDKQASRGWSCQIESDISGGGNENTSTSNKILFRRALLGKEDGILKTAAALPVGNKDAPASQIPAPETVQQAGGGSPLPMVKSCSSMSSSSLSPTLQSSSQARGPSGEDDDGDAALKGAAQTPVAKKCSVGPTPEQFRVNVVPSARGAETSRLKGGERKEADNDEEEGGVGPSKCDAGEGGGGWGATAASIESAGDADFGEEAATPRGLYSSSSPDRRATTAALQAQHAVLVASSKVGVATGAPTATSAAADLAAISAAAAAAAAAAADGCEVRVDTASRAKAKVAVLAPAECVRHVTPEGHQESLKRLQALVGARDGALRRPEFGGHLEWVSFGESYLNQDSPAKATKASKLPLVCEADLLRVHDWEYLEQLKHTCAAVQARAKNSKQIYDSARDTSSSAPAQTFANVTAAGVEGAVAVAAVGGGPEVLGQVDSDTKLSAGSWQAALAAAGACVKAVEWAMEGWEAERDEDEEEYARRAREGSGLGEESNTDNNNGEKEEEEEEKEGAAAAAGGCGERTKPRLADRCCLVACRPPGHHAGSRGCVPHPTHFATSPDMCSCGFCLINNVAVAAAHARYKYGGCGVRVAIVDWDIHHGNGTQDIVENLVPREVPLPLPPSWPQQTYRTYKPWYDGASDPSSVFFGSINLEDGVSFYPGDGAKERVSVSGALEDEKSGGAAGSRAAGSRAAALRKHIVNVTLTPVDPLACPLAGDQTASSSSSSSKLVRPGNLIGRKRQSVKDRSACIRLASNQFRFCGLVPVVVVVVVVVLARVKKMSTSYTKYRKVGKLNHDNARWN